LIFGTFTGGKLDARELTDQSAHVGCDSVACGAQGIECGQAETGEQAKQGPARE
jgi:hypothetical protein